jgi:hypothetical protein
MLLFLAIADLLRPQSLELRSTLIYGVRISFESFSGVILATSPSPDQAEILIAQNVMLDQTCAIERDRLKGFTLR